MSSRVVQLAKIISESTALFEDYLQRTGVPTPSLGIDAPKKLATTKDVDAEAARIQVIAAANELSDLLKGPAELIRHDWTEHASLRLILRLNIPSLVPVGSEVSFLDIASKTGLPELDIRRILRHAMCRHIFVEPRKDYVAHTAISRLLAEDDHQRAIASTIANVMEPSLVHTTDTMEKYPGSEEITGTGFSHAMNREKSKSMWETFTENPEMGRQFGVFISEKASNDSLLTGVDWKGVVVDIGGSHGSAMIDVLNSKKHSVDKAVIQDLPEPVKAGKLRAPKELLETGRLDFHAQYVPTAEDPEDSPTDFFNQ